MKCIYLINLHSYLEHGGEEMTVRPWVWIFLLFLGPTAGTFAFQWYVYTAVSSGYIFEVLSHKCRLLQTRVTVHVKAIITQLIFEHALRVRMKAETAETKSAPPTPGKTPDVVSLAEPATAEHPALASAEAEMGEAAVLRDSAALQSPAPKEETSKQESSGGASNLVGRINNLVTTDMQTIESGRDFIFVCEHSLR